MASADHEDGELARMPIAPRSGRWLAILSGCLIAMATLSPANSRPVAEHYCVVCGSAGGVDALLNLFMFVPLGVGLAIAGLRASRAILFMCAITLTIEVLQLEIVVGRDASLGDLVTNSAGGALGFALGRNLTRLLWPGQRLAPLLVLGWCGAWLTVLMVTAYTMIPSMPPPPYVGQVAHAFGPGIPSFTGQVFSATVDSIPLTDTLLSSGRELRGLLARHEGARTQAIVLPDGVPPGMASIVRVVATRNRDILSLEQDDADLVFGVRTGAETLRLRTYGFRLRDVFTHTLDGPGQDTVVVAGKYARKRVSVSGGPIGRQRSQEFTPALSNGWRLVMPVQTYAAGDPIEHFLSALWLGSLAFPAGYWWGIAATRVSGSRQRKRGVVAAAAGFGAALVVGLFGIPTVMMFAPTPPLDWMATLAGVGIGAAAARTTLAVGQTHL